MRGEGLGPAEELRVPTVPLPMPPSPCGETMRCRRSLGLGVTKLPPTSHTGAPSSSTYPGTYNSTAAIKGGLGKESKRLVRIGPCGAGGDTGVPSPPGTWLSPALSRGCQGIWGHHCGVKGNGLRGKTGKKTLGISRGDGGEAFPSLCQFSLAWDWISSAQFGQVQPSLRFDEFGPLGPTSA